MVLTLYVAAGSVPCCSVLLVCKYLGIKHKVKTLDLTMGEHRTKKFLELNPEHTVPMIQDDDVTLWESHAILLHLLEAYQFDKKKGDHLLPSPGSYNERAHVQRWLFFDLGTLCPAIAAYVKVHPLLNRGANANAHIKEQFKLDDVLQLIEQALHNSNEEGGFLTPGAQKPSVADLAIAVSLKTLDFARELLAKRTVITEWQERVAAAFQPHWNEVMNASLMRSAAKEWDLTKITDEFLDASVQIDDDLKWCRKDERTVRCGLVQYYDYARWISLPETAPDNPVTRVEVFVSDVSCRVWETETNAAQNVPIHYPLIISLTRQPKVHITFKKQIPANLQVRIRGVRFSSALHKLWRENIYDKGRFEKIQTFYSVLSDWFSKRSKEVDV